jgi:hypothetical protein
VADPDNERPIALSSGKFIGTSIELKKTDPAKVTRYCAEAKEMIAGLLPNITGL